MPRSHAATPSAAAACAHTRWRTLATSALRAACLSLTCGGDGRPLREYIF